MKKQNWLLIVAVILLSALPLWFAPLSGAGTVGDVAWTPGECWLVPDAASIAGAGRAIVAWAT